MTKKINKQTIPLIYFFLLHLAISITNACEFNTWQEWSQCSATCGSTASRTRIQECDCTNVGSGDFQDPSNPVCSSGDIQTEVDNCGFNECATAEWTDWSSLGCSEACGGGIEVLERTCLSTENGQEVDDALCVGNSQSLVACNTDPCDGQDVTTTTPTIPKSTAPPLTNQPQGTGNWLEWGAWSACSKSCDSGYRFRERMAQTTYDYRIESEFRPGFYYKNGEQEYQEEFCNTDSCGKCVYNNWTEWSDCSSKCSSDTTTRSRMCVCSGVSSFCTGDGHFDPALANANDLTYEEIAGGAFQAQKAFCQAFSFDLTCAQNIGNPLVFLPLVQTVTIKFISYVIKPRFDAEFFFRDDGLSEPHDQQRWENLFNSVQIYIQVNLGYGLMYKPQVFKHLPAYNLITDYDTELATELAIPVATDITFEADPLAGNPQSIQDFTDEMHHRYKKFPKRTAYGSTNRRIGRRKRSDDDEIFSGEETTMEQVVLFDNENADEATTGTDNPQLLTSLYPDSAIYQLLTILHESEQDVANFLLTGCHCMKFGSYSTSIQKLLGGSTHINDLDEQCQKLFGQTRCAFSPGGKCANVQHLKKTPYIVAYDDQTKQLSCDSISTWEPNYSPEELDCITDLCLIHNYYFQGILDYINTNGGVTANPGIDLNNLLDNQCVHPGNSHTVTCTGDAPHLKFIKA